MYSLKIAVWEITNACNMRCRHCGSGSGRPKSDELSTEEALKLCDEMGALGLKFITLSGGEPFLRKDWNLIAKRLYEKGVIVNIISNGWFIDEGIIKLAFDAGISNIAVSLDGLEETHDLIRTKGGFQKAVGALGLMKEMGMPSAVATCINKKNISELSALRNILIQNSVERWQLQLAEPMGNLLDHKDLILTPTDIGHAIDYAYKAMKEGGIIVDVADNIGYFDIKTTELRSQTDDYESHGMWAGCEAGKSLIGIRCNGDITPCLSIRDDGFIEGNIRTTPLSEIWTRPGAFAWNRQMTADKLVGFCKTCQYAEACLGGCTNLKLTYMGNLYENKYCVYRVEFEKETEKINSINDTEKLIALARGFAEEEQFELAEISIAKVLKKEPSNTVAIDIMGFVKYSLGKYEESIELNKKSLRLNPSNAYAYKGLGICYSKTGRAKEGIELLYKSIELAKDDFMEPYYDLAVVLDENGQTKEAIEILDKGRAKSKAFISRSEELYKYLSGRV